MSKAKHHPLKRFVGSSFRFVSTSLEQLLSPFQLAAFSTIVCIFCRSTPILHIDRKNHRLRGLEVCVYSPWCGSRNLVLDSNSEPEAQETELFEMPQHISEERLRELATESRLYRVSFFSLQ